MSYAPATLRELSGYLLARGVVQLGIVGDAAHTSGYHLGRDRIYDGAGPGLGDQDYSVKLDRDRAGLTDGAAAIDLGRVNGSLTELQRMSRSLVAACQSGAAGSTDVREVIYSPDGVTVQRWSGPDRHIYTGPGNGDSSHLWHTHVSYYRDSEGRSKLALWRSLFPTLEAPAMPAIDSYLPGYTATVKATSNVRDAPSLTGAILRTATAAEAWTIVGTVKGDTDPDCGGNDWLVRWAGRWEYTSRCNVTAGPTAPAGDCTAAVKAATDPLAAEVAQLQATVAGEPARTQTAILADRKTATARIVVEYP